ncbi:MAG: ATP-binding cassette domain-containing protein [SAR202 cluster bacterium]|nr:ATP-binding cassette domain-containing protein [SAR202 cluster bacterium]
MPLVNASEIGISFGELEVLSNISLEIVDRARVGVVGPNGQGKTSLLKMLTGEYLATQGNIYTQTGISIGYVPQTTDDMNSPTLKDEVIKAFADVLQIEHDIATSATAIEASSGSQRRQAELTYSRLLEEYEAAGGYEYQNRLERVVEGVGLSLQVLETPPDVASGGQRTRAALAKALLIEPDLLILDEPTNYLDFQGLSWLENFLDRTTRAFVVVSHDRYFLDRVTTEIWEINEGQLTPYKGNYSAYRHLKDEQDRRHLNEYTQQQAFIAKEREFIERYRAGQRSQEAKGREKRLSRIEKIEYIGVDKSINLQTSKVVRSGRNVLSTQNLEIGYVTDETQVKLLTSEDIVLERGSRTGIIGENGKGKTTFLNTILGITPPITGSSSLGHNVRVGFQRQGSYDLPEDRSVIDAVLDIENLPPLEARKYLARFLFQGEDVFKPVPVLSGGERTRLALARLLLENPNFLILDEPTSHLDIGSREALEEVLQQFDGTLLFVSHDRALISLLANQLLIFEDGSVTLVKNNFAEWAEKRDEAALDTIGRCKPAVKTKRRKQQTKQSHVSDNQPIDYAGKITSLESRLVRIEQALLRASQENDIDKTKKLGLLHAETSLEIEATWQAWGN